MALTREQLSALAPPTGWVWNGKPTLRTSGYIALDSAQAVSNSNASTRLATLHAWAKENELGLKVVVGKRQIISGDYWDMYFPSEFKVIANSPEVTEHTLGDYTCSCGRKTQGYNDPQPCGECGRYYCQNCNVAYVKLHKIAYGRRFHMYCSTCSVKCKKKGCSGRYLEGGDCGICNPQIVCLICLNSKSGKDAVTIEDENQRVGAHLRYQRQFGSRISDLEQYVVCAECAPNYYCKTCKKYDFDSPSDKGECALCADAKIEAERAKLEELPRDWVPQGGTLVIPSVAHRPFRTISYEMELDGDGPLIARTLYRCGLVPISKVAGYSQHPKLDNEYPCFLKYDSSVSGGELIAYLLNLDDKTHADVLLDTCKKVHSLEQLKKASHGPTCGGHIHVDAHNFNYGDAWRLVTGFGYIEDPFYRIAGAGAKYGHRSLDPANKARNGGEGYTNSPVKGPFGNKGALGRSIAGQARNSGLNFTPYLGASQMCECGAMAYEDSKNCKCNLGKATIEFRVFNSTHNPRILHAWIALIQGLMAWSEGDSDPDGTWEAQYPALGWKEKPFSALSSTEKAVVKERVEWIFRELPLTEAERDSLAYACGESDMDFGPGWPDELRGIIPLNAFPEKKPARNPARRQRAIKVAAPTPGAPEGAVSDGREQTPRVRNPFPSGTRDARIWATEHRRARERASRLVWADESGPATPPTYVTDTVEGQ